MRKFNKTPVALLDWAFDWSNWLLQGESIQTYELTISDGLTVQSDSNDAQHVVVWLSDGSVGETYKVTCQVTTDQGRIDERACQIVVTEDD